jgi:hypothetical protein
MFLDDTACNLASINLMKFRKPDGEFDVERFTAACRVFLIAQEILVDHASYPTARIAKNSHLYRPLGLGYSNLGSLPMAWHTTRMLVEDCVEHLPQFFTVQQIAQVLNWLVQLAHSMALQQIVNPCFVSCRCIAMLLKILMMPVPHTFGTPHVKFGMLYSQTVAKTATGMLRQQCLLQQVRLAF